MVHYIVEEYPRLGGKCRKIFESKHISAATLVWWWKQLRFGFVFEFTPRPPRPLRTHIIRIREFHPTKDSFEHRIMRTTI